MVDMRRRRGAGSGGTTRREAAPPGDHRGRVRLGEFLCDLRERRGYTLGDVEVRVRRAGRSFHKSQLSLYERGKSFPSLESASILAEIYQCSPQAFHDVITLADLETTEAIRGSLDDLIVDAERLLESGEYVAALARYERAVEMLEVADADRQAAIRVSRCQALTKLGKIALAQHELEELIREDTGIEGITQAKAMLVLSNIYSIKGIAELARIYAGRAAEIASDGDVTIIAAMAQHAIAGSFAARQAFDKAIDPLNAAIRLYKSCGNETGALQCRIGLGSSYGMMGKRSAVRILEECRIAAARLGNIRLEALASYDLGRVLLSTEPERAKRCLAISEQLIVARWREYADIHFCNLFCLWQLAERSGDSREAKRLWVELSVTRPHVERCNPDVQEYDRLVSREVGDE